LFIEGGASLDRDTTDRGRFRRSRGGISTKMTWIPRTCLVFMAAIIGSSSSSAFAPAHRVAMPSLTPKQCTRGKGTRMAFDSNHKSKQEGFDFASLRVNGLPAVVLVRPSLDRNIGACARNMLNFGLTDIRCEISSVLNTGSRGLQCTTKLFLSPHRCEPCVLSFQQPSTESWPRTCSGGAKMRPPQRGRPHSSIWRRRCPPTCSKAPG